MSSTTDSDSRQLSATEAMVPIASLIVLVAMSFFLFGDAGALGPNQVALTVATMIGAFVGWRAGYMISPRCTPNLAPWRPLRTSSHRRWRARPDQWFR